MFNCFTTFQYSKDDDDVLIMMIDKVDWILPDRSRKLFDLGGCSNEIIVHVHQLATRALREAFLGSAWLKEMPKIDLGTFSRYSTAMRGAIHQSVNNL